MQLGSKRPESALELKLKSLRAEKTTIEVEIINTPTNHGLLKKLHEVDSQIAKGDIESKDDCRILHGGECNTSTRNLRNSNIPALMGRVAVVHIIASQRAIHQWFIERVTHTLSSSSSTSQKSHSGGREKGGNRQNCHCWANSQKRILESNQLVCDIAYCHMVPYTIGLVRYTKSY
jgi:hypothetical protein